ncbi:MAG: hypothetical protein RSA05_00170 [Cetobacterium sp.]|uniref:hypothetical protein n=1 Tax=Cetobacterium sp. TaxID=2071632 RepID=UPI002FC823EC
MKKFIFLMLSFLILGCSNTAWDGENVRDFEDRDDNIFNNGSNFWGNDRWNEGNRGHDWEGHDRHEGHEDHEGREGHEGGHGGGGRR